MHDGKHQENEFEVFFKQLSEEASEYGLQNELTVEDAKEMFALLQEELAEERESLETDGQMVAILNDMDISKNVSTQIGNSLRGPMSGEDPTVKVASATRRESEVAVSEYGRSYQVQDSPDNEDLAAAIVGGEETPPGPELEELDGLDEYQLFRIRQLQAALPGLPTSRIKKVAKTFEDTLGYPSLLSLVPLLRETLPDHITLGWLRRMNARNADFVLKKADEENLVDISMLNSMLQTKTSSSSLSEAENFHRDEFRRHNLVSGRISCARPRGHTLL